MSTTKQTINIDYLTCTVAQNKSSASVKCSYDPSEFVVALGNPAAQSWALILMPLAGFLCYGILGFLSHRMKYPDFTRNFVMFQAGPLSVLLLLRLILGCVFMFQPRNAVSFPDFLSVLYDYLRRSADFNLYFGVTVFLYLCLKVARQRQPLTSQYSWTPFVAAVGFSYAISLFSFISLVQVVYTGALWIVRTFYSLFSLVTLFAVCCCSSPVFGQSPEPYVSNARSRMLWTLPFHIPYIYALSMREYASMLAWYIDLSVPTIRSLGMSLVLDTSGMRYVAFASDLVEPFLIFLGVVAFLPAYRSVMLRTEGYTNPRIGQVQIIQVVMQAPPPTQQKPPMN